MHSVQILKGHRLQAEYCDALRRLAEMMRPYDFLQERVAELSTVADAAISPFHVAVFGYMKTGKSSLINAIIGKPLAITGVDETTATINLITYADGDQLETFVAHWKDEPATTLPIERLHTEWSGTSDEVSKRVQRVTHLELHSNIKRLQDIHIIDTPGMGSTTMVHDEAARQFISGQQSDAIVYVFSPVVREMDAAALSSFRSSCLPNSDPYNSIAILHKWDDIYWNNGGNMEEIHELALRARKETEGLVADVLPVSAPLALLAEMASPEFWQSTLDVLAGIHTEQEMERALRGDDERWARQAPEREQLYLTALREYGMPWISFKVMIRHLFRAMPDTPEEASSLILKLSGMPAFRQMLDHRIFAQQAVIRLRQIRARAQRALDLSYKLINDTISELSIDMQYMSRMQAEASSEDLKEWLRDKLDNFVRRRSELKKHWNEIDKLRCQLEEEQNREDGILKYTRWLDSEAAACFPDSLKARVKSILTGEELPREKDFYDILEAVYERRNISQDVDHLHHLLLKIQVDNLPAEQEQTDNFSSLIQKLERTESLPADACQYLRNALNNPPEDHDAADDLVEYLERLRQHPVDEVRETIEKIYQTILAKLNS